MFKIFSFVAILVFISATSATDFRKCGSQPQPTSVSISGCTKEPCKVVEGKDVVVEVKFKSPIDSNTLAPKIVATALGIPITVPIPEDMKNGCNFLKGENKTCPLMADTEYVYQVTIPIPKVPKITADLEVSLLGDKEAVVQCFKVKCKVTGSYFHLLTKVLHRVWWWRLNQWY